MFAEYVRVTTTDGIELQGLLSAPNESSTKAVIHIHGLNGNFYENRFIDSICSAVVNEGWNFLTINTRGHDYIADILEESVDGLVWRQIGAAFEQFEDCLIDIAAAINFLASRNCSIIVLEGHSTGALKVSYYLSQTLDDRVKGLILLSPADDLGLQKAELGARYDEVLGRAQQMVAAGRSIGLMPRADFENVISAGTYVNMFGPDSKHAIFEFSNEGRHEFPELEAIGVPVLATMGTKNEAILSDADTFLSALNRYTKHVESFQARVIEGAPHRYLKYEATLAGIVAGWLRTTISQ